MKLNPVNGTAVLGSKTDQNQTPTGERQVPQPHDETVQSVLFVCWCNVCRSPAAEAVLEKYLASQSLGGEIKVDSAGVCVDEKSIKPSFAMRWAAFRRGYRLKKQTRQISRVDLNKYDLVIAMDKQNLSALQALVAQPRSAIKLLSDFLPRKYPRSVPDPMNRPLKICHKVFDWFEAACPRITSYLLDEEATTQTAHLSADTTVVDQVKPRQKPS